MIVFVLLHRVDERLSDLVSVEDLVGEGVKFADGLHGCERFEVCLDLGPLFGIFFGDDGSEWVGIVVNEIVFELGRDNLVGMFGDHVQECGVGLIGQWVAAGFDYLSGIEIAVGDVVLDAIVDG